MMGDDMTHFVKRVRPDGSVAWTGPIRSPRQAEREAQAWRESGIVDTAEVLPADKATWAEVRAWEKAKK
jgi:hypothetical protein